MKLGIHDIAGIVSVALIFFWILYGVYQRSKGDVLGAIARFIAYAEQTGMTGAEKMDTVVENLYEIVPAPFKTLLTRDRLRAAAQGVYDWMHQYAITYLLEKSATDDKGKEVAADGAADNTSGGDTEDDEPDETEQIFMEEVGIVPEIADGDGPGD